jgi:restriction endonuclease-like protein
MAAALACGEGAVVSHRSAAQLWRLLPYPARKVPVEIAVVRDLGTKPGIRLHRVRRLDLRDVRKCNGIPVTAPGRTVLDLAGQRPIRDFEQALAEAEMRHLVNRCELLAVLVRNEGRRGAGVLRSALAKDRAPALTRSEAEERFLALTGSAGLPSPDVNVRLGLHEVDFLWRRERLVVEVDGFRFHSSRLAFERDRLRDAELQADGFRVIRVTWRQIVNEPEGVLARLSRALGTAPRPASPRGPGAVP